MAGSAPGPVVFALEEAHVALFGLDLLAVLLEGDLDAVTDEVLVGDR